MLLISLPSASSIHTTHCEVGAMINYAEFDFVDKPSEEFRFVLIHPEEGVLFFSNPQTRDEYAEEAAADLAGSDLLCELCCGEIDILFEPHGLVH